MKKFFAEICVLILSAFVFALPGVSKYLEDNSGEFVFYRDKSFTTESVVGFLFYNEETYAARFYSPYDKKSGSDERDITIYVSVNSASGNFELTGEKIQGIKNQDDSFIVNYLHDLLYEFSSRRKNADLGAEKISCNEDFAQFGGDVEIFYNPLVPIFNIESIKSSDGKFVFALETSGVLSSAADESFASYKGIPGLPKDKKRGFKKPKSKLAAVSYGNQKITLDESWSQSMDNAWLLGDWAILFLAEMKVPQEFDAAKAKSTLTKKYSQGTDKTYSLFREQKIAREKNQTKISNVLYQTETGDVMRDFKILTDNGNGNFSLLTLTVFDGAYQSGRNYFNKILESYCVE